MLNNLFQYNIYDYDSIFVTNILILYSYFYQGWTFAARCRQRLLIGCWRSQLRCTGIIVHHTHTHTCDWCNALHTNTNRYLLSVKPNISEMGLTLQDRWHLRIEKQSEDSDNKHCSVFRSLKWIKQVTKTASMACISFVSLGSLQWVHPTHPNKVWTHRHPRTTVLLSSSAVDYRYRYCAGSGWLWGEAISCTLPPWWRSSPVWRGRGRKRVHSSPKAPITPLHHPSQVCL